MTPFTGTRDDFERLAPRGLVLKGFSVFSSFFLYYGDDHFRYSRSSTLPTDADVIRGAWDAFDDATIRLFIYRYPTYTIYRRHP